jgi:hypothetical protein
MDELTLTETPSLVVQPEPNGKPPADAKQMRVEAVGALLGEAYKGASQLKLKPNEIKELTEPFSDDEVEIRPHDGLLYLPHMVLRTRLWKVFGPTEVAEILRERAMSPETSEIMVDLVLMVRGHFLAEAIGTSRWFANNPKQSKGDAIESAWSEALRRCCKRISVGTDLWKPGYVREWMAKYAVQQGGKWMRKDDPRLMQLMQSGRKTRDYTLKDDKPVSEFQKMKAAVQAAGEPEIDEATGLPF